MHWPNLAHGLEFILIDLINSHCCCRQVASVVSDSVRPHRRQPTRLPRPWDSPGKNTGVGCHFLLQCMKVKSESEVAQSCPTLRDPMNSSLLGSSVHGIFQARILEWGAFAFSELILISAIKLMLLFVQVSFFFFFVTQTMLPWIYCAGLLVHISEYLHLKFY